MPRKYPAKRILFAINSKEVQRYARFFISPGDELVLYEDIKSWWQAIPSRRAEPATIIVLGARPPDKAVARRLLRDEDVLIILQHAVNKRRSLKELSTQYFVQNYIKLIYWSIFILFCQIFGLNSASNKSNLFYFTESYILDWKSAFQLHQVKCISSPRPDPSKYGSIQDIPVSTGEVPYYFIDEPFTETLGVSESVERKILHGVLQEANGRDVYVKVHPRSNKEKYEFSSRFVLTDCIYRNADVIIGFKSGLLNYPFKSSKRMLIEIKGKNVIFKRESVEDVGRLGDYVNFVNGVIRKHGD